MVGLRQGIHGGGAGGRAAGLGNWPTQNFNFGNSGNPAQAIMNMGQGGGGGISFPGGPQGGDMSGFFGPGGPQAPDLGSYGQNFQSPDYSGFTGMPGYQLPGMPTFTGNQSPTHIGVGDVNFDFEAQNPLKLGAMQLFGQLSGQGLQAYLGQMGERGTMNRAILQNMLGFGGLGVQRELGFGNIGANIFGTQAGLYGQMQGYEQSQREAEMRQKLGFAGLEQQKYSTDLQHKLGMYGLDAPHTQRMETLDRLFKLPGLSGLTGGGAGGSPTTAPTSMLAMGGGATGPFEDAFARREGAASAGNAAGIEQARQAMIERATGPGGGQAGAAGINPLMAHSRAMADTQSSANLRQQMLGERQLGSSLLGALGGLI